MSSGINQTLACMCRAGGKSSRSEEASQIGRLGFQAQKLREGLDGFAPVSVPEPTPPGIVLARVKFDLHH